MKKYCTCVAFIWAICITGMVYAQDTFSIVAVDPETGEVGSAGASCVDGAAQFGGVILLSGIIPGKGAINAQAWICINPHVNLENGLEQMEMGLSPDEIIAWLQTHDQCVSQNFDPEYRQYGIADFDDLGNPRAAAFTGSKADDWKGHIVGDNYAIQGNILIGSQVLEQMEANFKATQGSLAEKLMTALQGANIPGADSRCLGRGTSSTSAFLRVFKPDDDPQTPWLELNVPEMPFGEEPIDSLQSLFDAWFVTNVENPDFIAQKPVAVYPNPARGYLMLGSNHAAANPPREAVLFDLQGRELSRHLLDEPAVRLDLSPFGQSVLVLKIMAPDGNILQVEKIVVQ